VRCRDERGEILRPSEYPRRSGAASRQNRDARSAWHHPARKGNRQPSTGSLPAISPNVTAPLLLAAIEKHARGDVEALARGISSFRSRAALCPTVSPQRPGDVVSDFGHPLPRAAVPRGAASWSCMSLRSFRRYSIPNADHARFPHLLNLVGSPLTQAPPRGHAELWFEHVASRFPRRRYTGFLLKRFLCVADNPDQKVDRAGPFARDTRVSLSPAGERRGFSLWCYRPRPMIAPVPAVLLRPNTPPAASRGVGPRQPHRNDRARESG
jgi:hypothetical protein